MDVPFILAHGALGVFDEVIFISVVMVFIVLMVFSWIRSRNLPDEDEQPDIVTEPTHSDASSDDHFSLE
jgi:hypothetical protein